MTQGSDGTKRHYRVTVHYSPRGGSPRNAEARHFQVAFKVHAETSSAATVIALAEFQHSAGLWREEVERVGVVAIDGR